MTTEKAFVLQEGSPFSLRSNVVSGQFRSRSTHFKRFARVGRVKRLTFQGPAKCRCGGGVNIRANEMRLGYAGISDTSVVCKKPEDSHGTAPTGE